MSLSTFFSRCRSAAADLDNACRPLHHSGDTEPPGRRPPAPGSQSSSTHSVTGGPFANLVGLNVDRQAGFRQSSLILAESKTIGWASVTCLLSLTPRYICGGSVCHNPCPFRWNRTPWQPTSKPGSHGECQDARSLRGASPSPDLRISSCDPEPTWASLLLPRQGRNPGLGANRREQYRRVLWYARYP
jgi:hypothetical protein